MRVRFFKEKDRWYADIPNHTLEENEMVFGADTLLNIISRGREEVTLDLSVSERETEPLITLEMVEHDDDGAIYNVNLDEYGWQMKDKLKLWICNVTHDVFDEHPQTIFIHNIEL